MNLLIVCKFVKLRRIKHLKSQTYLSKDSIMPEFS